MWYLGENAWVRVITNSVNWGQEAPRGRSVVVSLHSVPGIANGIEHRLYEICN